MSTARFNMPAEYIDEKRTCPCPATSLPLTQYRDYEQRSVEGKFSVGFFQLGTAVVVAELHGSLKDANLHRFYGLLDSFITTAGMETGPVEVINAEGIREGFSRGFLRQLRKYIARNRQEQGSTMIIPPESSSPLLTGLRNHLLLNSTIRLVSNYNEAAGMAVDLLKKTTLPVPDPDPGRQKPELTIPSGSTRMDQLENLDNDEGAMKNGIWRWKPASGEISFNDRFYTQANYAPYDFPMKLTEWENRIHPGDRETAAGTMKRLETGEFEKIEISYRFIKKRGGYIWLNTRGRVAAKSPNGKPEAILVIHSDITRSQESRQDLHRREENFFTLFNTLSSIILIFTTDGRISYSNTTARNQLEYSEEELKNMHIQDLYPWNLRSEAQYMIKEVLEQGIDSFSLPLVPASDTPLQVETTLHKGFWDGRESIFHISRDVSEERTLIGEMRRIKSSVETSEDAVYIIDPACNYLFHNRSMERIFGLSFMEVLKLDLNILFKTPETGPEVYRELFQKDHVNSELEMVNTRGDELAIHLRASAIHDERGKISALSYTFTDITRIKESNLQLAESEKRLTLALSSSGKGVWEWNSRDQKFFMDSHSYAIAGYPPQGFPADKAEFEKRVHPSDERVFENLWNALEKGESSSLEVLLRFRRFDGSYMWIQIEGKTVEKEEGREIIKYVGTFSDLTADKERGRRRELLSSIQNRLLQPGSLTSKLKMVTDMIIPAADASFARIWLIKTGDHCDSRCGHYTSEHYREKCLPEGKCLHLMTSSGIYTHLDGTHSRIPLGAYKIGGIGGGKFDSFYTNNLLEDPRVDDKEWVQQENMKSFAGFKLTDPEEQEIGALGLFSRNTISEELFDYLESIASLTSQVIQNSWNLTALDESRNKALKLADEAETARREAVEMYEQLTTIRLAVNSSSDGIAVSTVGGEFFYLNRTFTEMLGFSITQLAETPQKLLFEEEDIFEKIISYTATGLPWQYQVQMLTRKGRSIPVFLRAVPFKDKNRVILGIVWNLTDISEQKESERKIRQYTRTIERDLADKEAMLKKARHLQKNFIQTTLPVCREFSLNALFLPCENLGGDFFHIIRGLHDNKLAIIIGDCTDHGIKASMDASILSSLVNQNLNILYSGNRTDLFMNRISIEYAKIADEDQFPTMFAAIIDLETKRMYYSNANSEPPVLFRGAELITFESTGDLHIGYYDDPDYCRKSFDFINEDRLLFYSDALAEIELENGSRLGHGGVERLFGSRGFEPERSFNRLIDQIEEVNRGLPLNDDTTLIQIDFIETMAEEYSFHNLTEWQPVKEQLRNRMIGLDFPLDDMEKTSIALEEMCINAFIHGNGEDESKTISLKARLDFKRVEFIITDEGEGFNPHSVPDPTKQIEEVMERDIEEEFTHGRGIWITGKLMDTAEYSPKANSVRIVKERRSKPVRFR